MAIRHNVQTRLGQPVCWQTADADSLAEAIDAAYEKQMGAQSP